MKTKKILILFTITFFLLIILNITISKTYEKYLYLTLNDITSNLVEAYPESEALILDIITKEDNNSNVLSKYGINASTIKEISNFKKTQVNTIIITSSIYLIIVSLFGLYFIYHNRKVKKEINVINKYLNEILKGSYELNIADYNEDELSILKNDIYKVTIKLKELSEYERKEQVYLMNTLEDISHQLKTPLTALMLTNDILKSGNLSESEYREFLNKETKELERMEWLTSTLLKYSKLDSGSVSLKKENIRAYDLIVSSLEPLNISIELKNIELVIENLNFNLKCDINWTKEAFTNIIKNAVEHLEPKGNITITGENNPLYKAITIKDNGVGIKESDIKNIFKRFYSTNSSKNSIGIGLNMAKLIFEKQNGTIEVTSKVGKYTEFKIIFYKNII